jgi:hypothetical protein
MSRFDDYYSHLLTEFNVEDRNDPAFYDYAVLFVKQLLQRNMLKPGSDVRRTSMDIVKKQFFNYIDEESNIQYKIEFVFDDNIEIPNNLTVNIKELPSGNVVKTIEDTHEETSIKDIVDFIQTKKQEDQQAGVTTPEQVGETPSEMPGAVQTQEPNTSQYLKGL